MYGYQPDPATAEYPLALISPASEKTISSTLGELRERAAVLQMNPEDAEARGLATDDPVRVFNALGEVHCPVALNKDIRRGTVAMPKGLWRKSTYNGLDVERARPRHAHRPRRRRVLQRRARPGGVAREALTTAAQLQQWLPALVAASLLAGSAGSWKLAAS